MLFNGNDIQVSFSCQQFQCNSFEIFVEDNVETGMCLYFHSTKHTNVVRCPRCGGPVHVYGRRETTLKSFPIWPQIPVECHVEYHQYHCCQCGETFTEEIGFRYPGTRVTVRAALFIELLLRHGATISAVQRITGIHWDTIRQIHMEMMEADLETRRMELKKAGYKPKYLAVDEFAIHKGHTYATCVMDLVLGDIIWVGKGRSMKDFQHFFKEIDMAYLSEVEAVAMDMNASYNALIEQHLPHAAIVYDRYHMQTQFGKDVLGAKSPAIVETSVPES